jgi:hypothetical protein
MLPCPDPSQAAGWLGPPRHGDGTSRGGYGRAVVEHHGELCVYCDRDLSASYEDWLELCVDHVVLRNAVHVGMPTEWIEGLVNHTTCCQACNEFVNGYRVAPCMSPPCCG